MSDELRVIPDLIVHDGAAFASSLDVARVFGKRHDDVLKRIRALVAQLPGQGGLGYFADTPYVDPQNRQTYSCFEITRDGFALLAMGFTGARALRFKLAYIARFWTRRGPQLARGRSEPSCPCPPGIPPATAARPVSG